MLRGPAASLRATGAPPRSGPAWSGALSVRTTESMRAAGPTSIEDQLIARLGARELAVPVLPRVAASVLGETDETFDFPKVSAQVHRDQALATHILRAANAAGTGVRAARITSLQQALVRLGIGRLRALLVAVVVKSELFSSRRHAARAELYWREAARTAHLARELARAEKTDEEAGFLGGLLASVGKPVVLDQIAAAEREGGVLVPSAEIDRLVETLHGLAGKRLVAAWRLPEWVAAVIAFFEHGYQAPVFPESVGSIRLAAWAAAGATGPPPPGASEASVACVLAAAEGANAFADAFSA